MGLIDIIFGNKKKEEQVQACIEREFQAVKESARIEKGGKLSVEQAKHLAENVRQQSKLAERYQEKQKVLKLQTSQEQSPTEKCMFPKTHAVSAQSILQEMASHDNLQAKAVFKRGVELHNEVSDVCTIQGGEKTIESLKILVKALELDKNESEMNGCGTSMLKPKILEFIASCNYRLGNFNNAYCVAKQALMARDEAIRDSIFTNLSREMYGISGVENIISLIERAYFDQVENENNIWAVDPSEIKTDIFNRFKQAQNISNSQSLISRQSIEALVEVIHKVQRIFIDQGNKSGNTEMFMIAKGLEMMFLNPLFYAWEKFNYGWHTDFLKEGDSMFDYMMFECDIKGNVENSIKCLETCSPFSMVENDGKITSSILAILRIIKDKLESGEFN